MEVESYPKWKETTFGGTHFPLTWCHPQIYSLNNLSGPFFHDVKPQEDSSMISQECKKHISQAAYGEDFYMNLGIADFWQSVQLQWIPYDSNGLNMVIYGLILTTILHVGIDGSDGQNYATTSRTGFWCLLHSSHHLTLFNGQEWPFNF